MPNATSCSHCGKTRSESESPFKRCAKCRSIVYCTRECQKNDWKVHKKVCASLAATSSTVPADPAPSSSAPPSGAAEAAKSSMVAIEKPFHHLNDKTWLHGRPEIDVFRLLIDCYRFRLEDDYSLEFYQHPDSIYVGCKDSRVDFQRFLRLAESRPGVLPSWWSPEKAAECLKVGLTDKDHNLQHCIEKHDVIAYYGDNMMPMQLRMLGEQIYLRGPGGQSGAAMIKMQMQVENGKAFSSTIDTSRMSRR
ncbi:hypothetical protein BGZ51_008097 [Haplosporangium sp. Z 767]|nr:hypothetical protein BGZ51_008097 [Haplosporangium sp. Z 767]KAF9178364.1 hypothetical protein BGZ50_007773 [Haplosporangium sp. Z 11]